MKKHINRKELLSCSCIQRVNRREQKGRSMVEILGVLAIVGVLSSGGVLAYNFLMNKHKANGLMEKALDEAVSISEKIRKKNSLKISHKNRSVFSSAEKVGLSHFKISLVPVDTSVCKQLKSMLDRTSLVYDISEDCSYMLFANILGEDSAIMSDLCAGKNCGHGFCSDGACICTDNYYGENCENAPLACQNGGSWNTETKECDCEYGYSGNTCQIEPDPCQDINCGTHGTCSDGACVCRDNYYGENCENAPLACQNGGLWNTTTHQCDCPNGYSGNTCGIKDPCLDVNCGTHGTCSNGACVCTDDYYGENCENAPLACQNGGTWNTSTHTCDCPTGYKGETCATKSSYCSENQCVVYKTKYTWSGARNKCGGIENMVSLADLGCTTSKCTNFPDYLLEFSFWVSNCKGTSCTNSSTDDSGNAYYIYKGGSVYSYTRNYKSYYAVCKATPDPCANVNCGDHGTCQNGACVCTDDYYGENCENAPLACQNGGSWNTETKECDCDYGYSGEVCQTEPDPCYGVDCGSHGTCSNGACVCEDGWTGDKCDEQEIKTCTDNSDCTEANTFCLMTSETSGTCEPLPSGTTVDVFLVHPTPMNLWSAQNWCEAHNMKIPTQGQAACGPFISDSNSYSMNIFNELFGIKKAYAAVERPTIDDYNYNENLKSLVSFCWGYSTSNQPIHFFASGTTCSYASEAPSSTAPVVCVPKNSAGSTDPCADFEPTICRTACTNNNGTAVYTYAEEGTSCGDIEHACDGEGNCNECLGDSLSLEYILNNDNYVKGDPANSKGCYCFGNPVNFTSPTMWNGYFCTYSGGAP